MLTSDAYPALAASSARYVAWSEVARPRSGALSAQVAARSAPWSMRPNRKALKRAETVSKPTLATVARSTVLPQKQGSDHYGNAIEEGVVLPSPLAGGDVYVGPVMRRDDRAGIRFEVTRGHDAIVGSASDIREHGSKRGEETGLGRVSIAKVESGQILRQRVAALGALDVEGPRRPVRQFDLYLGLVEVDTVELKDGGDRVVIATEALLDQGWQQSGSAHDVQFEPGVCISAYPFVESFSGPIGGRIHTYEFQLLHPIVFHRFAKGCRQLTGEHFDHQVAEISAKAVHQPVHQQALGSAPIIGVDA